MQSIYNMWILISV